MSSTQKAQVINEQTRLSDSTSVDFSFIFSIVHPTALQAVVVPACSLVIVLSNIFYLTFLSHDRHGHNYDESRLCMHTR